MKRLIIRAKLDQLTIFLIHLSLKSRHRQHQFEELHQLINDCETEHVIVTGDFNTLWENREPGLFLAATGLISADPDNAPSHPSHSPPRQLDFILHSPGVSIQSFFIPQVQLSDHMLLVCDFTY
jgi:endonuclease/exonuclease/phosphatase family metal-dependent hydrolase